jgi:hypothetical protein
MGEVLVGDWVVLVGHRVRDAHGERVGRVAGAEEDCLVVDRGEVFLDHVPSPRWSGSTGGRCGSG